MQTKNSCRVLASCSSLQLFLFADSSEAIATIGAIGIGIGTATQSVQDASSNEHCAVFANPKGLQIIMLGSDQEQLIFLGKC